MFIVKTDFTFGHKYQCNIFLYQLGSKMQKFHLNQRLTASLRGPGDVPLVTWTGTGSLYIHRADVKVGLKKALHFAGTGLNVDAW